MDSYKPSARLTPTAGMRVTWNTNVVDDQGLFARPAGSFLDMQHSNAQPLNQAILTPTLRCRAMWTPRCLAQ